jgi:hypothetical protein
MALEAMEASKALFERGTDIIILRSFATQLYNLRSLHVTTPFDIDFPSSLNQWSLDTYYHQITGMFVQLDYSSPI